MAVNTVTKEFLRDPYREWLDAQKLPVIDDFAVDLIKVETAPWDRLGAEAAFVNLKGQGDFLSILVAVLPPGKSTSEQRHMYEEIVYVLEGHGSTTITARAGDPELTPTGSIRAINVDEVWLIFDGDRKVELLPLDGEDHVDDRIAIRLLPHIDDCRGGDFDIGAHRQKLASCQCGSAE